MNTDNTSKNAVQTSPSKLHIEGNDHREETQSANAQQQAGTPVQNGLQPGQYTRGQAQQGQHGNIGHPRQQAQQTDVSPSLPSQPTKPLKAAKGDDDLMSKPQQTLPSAGQIKGEWKQRVGDAKILWGKLTDDELLKTEGHADKLAGLVQQRYAITRDEATRQIKAFLA
jgi:uncharacterized protein YjbJ (UPF0337 family)